MSTRNSNDYSSFSRFRPRDSSNEGFPAAKKPYDIGERHASACRYKNEVPLGSRPMALDLILDSLTRSVSEGIVGENKQPKPLANASGYKVSAIGR